MVTLNFHVIHHIKIDDISCHKNNIFNICFHFASGKIPTFEVYLGVGEGVELYLLSKKLVNHFIFSHKTAV